MQTIQHWIAGSETTGASARFGPVYDPASGSQQARVALAERADVNAAVTTAAKAFEEWADASLTRRARVMFAMRDLVERHADELARIVSAEHGKVVSDAKGEVIRGLEVIEFASGIPTLLKGEYSEQVSTGVDAYSYRQPLGVCAGITPFNFPVMVPAWMHPIAIAAGNTFVLKPSERAPSASNFVAALYAEAGLPAGVFNVVHGDKVAVDAPAWTSTPTRFSARSSSCCGPRRSTRPSRSSTPTAMATAPRSSPPAAGPRRHSSRRSRPGWSALTSRSRSRWPSTRSAAGRTRCSATPTCTVLRVSASTPAPRQSPAAGRTRTTPRSAARTCTSRPPPDHLAVSQHPTKWRQAQ